MMIYMQTFKSGKLPWTYETAYDRAASCQSEELPDIDIKIGLNRAWPLYQPVSEGSADM